MCLEESIGLIFGGRKGDISIRCRLHLAEECSTWHILPLLVLSVGPERAHVAALWGRNRPPPASRHWTQVRAWTKLVASGMAGIKIVKAGGA